ncbi:MAG: hypothetical protein WBX50_08595, partial [Candidatus Deferrimicrobiaceae bacterium]
TDNVGIPVSFSGVGSDDPDGQQLTYRWVLVSRPAGSNASLPASNVPDVSFTPDATGTYVVGLRVDDGLDNSSLVTKSYTAVNGAATGSGGGGGGGCAYVNGKGEDDAASTVATLLLLLSPLGVLWARKRGYRFPRQCLHRSSLQR